MPLESHCPFLSRDLRPPLLLHTHSPMVQQKACSAPEDKAMSEAREHGSRELDPKEVVLILHINTTGPSKEATLSLPFVW